MMEDHSFYKDVTDEELAHLERGVGPPHLAPNTRLDGTPHLIVQREART